MPSGSDQPRNAAEGNGRNGKPSLIDIEATFLPTGQMRQVSRVTEVTPDSITGEIDLGPSHWVYPQHFPGDPIFPGTLMIEAAGQLVALWAWANGHRGKPRLVRANADFLNPVGPLDHTLSVRAQVKRRRNLFFGTVKLDTAAQEVAAVTLTLVVLNGLSEPCQP
jgi:3-hydroxymyristoyl/3-hydroxydecanoyl-(acyl carrier protein) dehydratase